MSFLSIRSSNLGSSLQDILVSDDIVPGSDPSYQMCKTIYLYHPLGAKMAEAPIAMAQGQEREISIPKSPEERVKAAFQEQWKRDGADKTIFNVMRLSRVYGIASVAVLADGVATDVPLDYKKLYQYQLSFNVFDPLNTAGSLVLNQDPNASDFQHVRAISVQGRVYHRSRAVVILNEDPIYIGYTTSAFGYVGRSNYQRALFPLKSFLRTMVTDDMVARKAGLLVAMMEQPGSIIDNLMQKLAGLKRQILKEAETTEVVSISKDEKVESLNLQNLEGPFTAARKNIIENVATAADMPAKLLLQESFAEGFGEGTEDAKHIADYIDRVRVSMAPLYMFFDGIIQRRAWNPDFFKTIQADFPEEYGEMDYEAAFYQWSNSFTAVWPSLLKEPESEQVKVEDVKLKAAVALLEALLAHLDPDNKATMIKWVADNFNDLKLLFQSPLFLDYEALAAYEPPQPSFGEAPGGAEGGDQKALNNFSDSVQTMIARGKSPPHPMNRLSPRHRANA